MTPVRMLPRMAALAAAVLLATAGLTACATPTEPDDVRVAPIDLQGTPGSTPDDTDDGGAEPVPPPEPPLAGNQDDATRRSPSPSPSPDDDGDDRDQGDDTDDNAADDPVDDSDDSDDTDTSDD